VGDGPEGHAADAALAGVGLGGGQEVLEGLVGLSFLTAMTSGVYWKSQIGRNWSVV
jgi:hypothetical protein